MKKRAVFLGRRKTVENDMIKIANDFLVVSDT